MLMIRHYWKILQKSPTRSYVASSQSLDFYKTPYLEKENKREACLYDGNELDKIKFFFIFKQYIIIYKPSTFLNSLSGNYLPPTHGTE